MSEPAYNRPNDPLPDDLPQRFADHFGNVLPQDKNGNPFIPEAATYHRRRTANGKYRILADGRFELLPVKPKKPRKTRKDKAILKSMGIKP